jgi:hypothetical protein
VGDSCRNQQRCRSGRNRTERVNDHG